MSTKMLCECYKSCIRRSHSEGGCRTKRNFYYNQAAAICVFLSTHPEEGPTYSDRLKKLTRDIFGTTDITVELTEVKNTLSKLRQQSAELPRPGLSPDGDNSHIMNHFKNEVSPQLQRDVIVTLFEFCRKELDKQRQSMDQAPVPNRYALIAFGSSARFEATPNSDFEWAILLNDDGSVESDCRNSFRELTTLFHFLVISLGETILPAMAIEDLEAIDFFDETTVRGFAFDGLMANACKWPLGNLHLLDWNVYDSEAFELIGRPQDLARFQSAENYQQRPEFAFSLLNARLISGDQSLFNEYGKKCTEIIRSQQDAIRPSVLNLLHEDCERYRFRTNHMSSFGVFLSPKDLYRLFDRRVLALWFYEKLSDAQCSQESLVVSLPTVELLDKVSCLGYEGKVNIRTAIQVSLWLRLRTHQSQRGRDVLPAADDEHVELIQGYYKTAIPFGDKLVHLLESPRPSLSSLRSETFEFVNTVPLHAIVMYRLGRFSECKALLQNDAESLQSDVASHQLRKWYLAHVDLRLGQFSEAAERFNELGKDETHPDELVKTKVLRFYALSHLPASKHLVDLILELEAVIFDATTTTSSATRAALELLRYYQLFNMVGEEQSLLSQLVKEKTDVVNYTYHLSEWSAIDWSNKYKVISHFRQKLQRLHRLYVGEASFRLRATTKFLRYCIRYDCIDAVQDAIETWRAQRHRPVQAFVIRYFEFFHALQHQNWSVARDCLVEWGKLVDNNDELTRMSRQYKAIFLASRLNFHLKTESFESEECGLYLQQSIELWENTAEIEKRGSDWGDLVLSSIGEIQRERGQLDEACENLLSANQYFYDCGDELKVATSVCAILKIYLCDDNPEGDIERGVNCTIGVFKKHRLYFRLADAYFVAARLLWSKRPAAEVFRLLENARRSYNRSRADGSVDPTLEDNILILLRKAKRRLRRIYRRKMKYQRPWSLVSMQQQVKSSRGSQMKSFVRYRSLAR